VSKGRRVFEKKKKKKQKRFRWGEGLGCLWRISLRAGANEKIKKGEG